jgi:IS30 family transposase
MPLIFIEAAMDDRFRDILEGLPEPAPRSCLDPLRELIDELHRRGRTYREIAHILAERCGVLVSVSTVFRFLHRRSRMTAQPRKGKSPQVPQIKGLSQTMVTEEKISLNSGTGATSDEVQRRITSLKLRPAPAQTKSQSFHYDPNEPLHLPSKIGKNRSDE